MASGSDPPEGSRKVSSKYKEADDDVMKAIADSLASIAISLKFKSNNPKSRNVVVEGKEMTVTEAIKAGPAAELYQKYFNNLTRQMTEVVCQFKLSDAEDAPLCKVQCETRRILFQHIMNNHYAIGNAVCNWIGCGRNLESKRDFRGHIGIHFHFMPFPCLICPRTFGTNTLVHYHREKWHPGEEIQFHQNIIQNMYLERGALYGETDTERRFVLFKRTVADNHYTRNCVQFGCQRMTTTTVYCNNHSKAHVKKFWLVEPPKILYEKNEESNPVLEEFYYKMEILDKDSNTWNAYCPLMCGNQFNDKCSPFCSPTCKQSYDAWLSWTDLPDDNFELPPEPLKILIHATLYSQPPKVDNNYYYRDRKVRFTKGGWEYVCIAVENEEKCSKAAQVICTTHWRHKKAGATLTLEGKPEEEERFHIQDPSQQSFTEGDWIWTTMEGETEWGRICWNHPCRNPLATGRSSICNDCENHNKWIYPKVKLTRAKAIANKRAASKSPAVHKKQFSKQESSK